MRGRQRQAAELYSRLENLPTGVQDEAAISLDRAAGMNGDLLAASRGGEFRSQLLQNIGQGQALRSVDHQTHSAIGVVLDDISQRLRKVRVCHVRHGDQELMLEVTRRYVFHEP